MENSNYTPLPPRQFPFPIITKELKYPLSSSLFHNNNYLIRFQIEELACFTILQKCAQSLENISRSVHNPLKTFLEVRTIHQKHFQKCAQSLENKSRSTHNPLKTNLEVCTIHQKYIQKCAQSLENISRSVHNLLKTYLEHNPLKATDAEDLTKF